MNSNLAMLADEEGSAERVTRARQEAGFGGG